MELFSISSSADTFGSTLREAFIEHAFNAAALAGIEAPPRDVFVRDKANPTFAAWSGIQRATAKGKAECSAEWLDPLLGFERFAAQIGPRPERDGVQLIDVRKPYSIANAKWGWVLPEPGFPPSGVRALWAHYAASEAERLNLSPKLFRREGKNYLYQVWKSMWHRCTSEVNRSFKHYGGRGITVHEEWSDDYILGFEWFVSWILDHLGERPNGRSLDRKDNDGNYEPGNLRWATVAEQMANTRRAKAAAERRQAAAGMTDEDGKSTAEIATTLGSSVASTKQPVMNLQAPSIKATISIAGAKASTRAKAKWGSATIRASSARRAKAVKEYRKEVIAMTEDGASVAIIAKALSRRRSTVRRLVEAVKASGEVNLAKRAEVFASRRRLQKTPPDVPPAPREHQGTTMPTVEGKR